MSQADPMWSLLLLPRYCNEHLPCPPHVYWSAWSAWERCTVPCGGGVQSRRRTCENGNDCPGCGQVCQRSHAPSLNPSLSLSVHCSGAQPEPFDANTRWWWNWNILHDQIPWLYLYSGSRHTIYYQGVFKTTHTVIIPHMNGLIFLPQRFLRSTDDASVISGAITHTQTHSLIHSPDKNKQEWTLAVAPPWIEEYRSWSWGYMPLEVCFCFCLFVCLFVCGISPV